jgi:RNA polymerase sigma-70 factor (ECF subfamily)
MAEQEALHRNACLSIAMNILDNLQEAEVCVDEAFRQAREEVSRAKPKRPGVFLGKLTRRLALAGFQAKKSAKRGNSLFLGVLDELDACVPAGSSGYGSGFDDETEARRVGEVINRFLKKQPHETRDVFICRYYYADSVGEITRRFGLSEKKVEAMLLRTRIRLRRFLESEGIRL